MPYFLKTTMSLSPMTLHISFRGTDAKGLASFPTLAALNIYFTGSQYVLKIALGEYLKILTYQALSDENDNIYLFFTYGASLIHPLLEALTTEQKQEIEKSKEISEKTKDKLDITFDTIESPAMKIQLEEEESESESEYFIPKIFFTPLSKKEVAEMYDRQMNDYLKIAMKLNQTNLESTIEVADSENEALIDEIINPRPGSNVDHNVTLSQSFDSNLDKSYTLSDTLNTRLHHILENVKLKINLLSYPPEPIEDIPNDPLYPLSQISTKDIYIDESLRNMLYLGGEEFYFKQPLTDDRKDFEISTPNSEMIVFKSPSLTFATIEKTNLKTILNNIIEDLGLNLNFLINNADKKETKQKITLLKNLNKRIETAKNKDIEYQLQSHEWLNQLIEDQLKNKTISYSFCQDYKNKKFSNKFPYITTRKRKSLNIYQKPLTFEDRLKDLPSMFKRIPADDHKKIESKKEIFSNIIGEIPPENYKKIKIDLYSSDKIKINQTKEDSE